MPVGEELTVGCQSNISPHSTHVKRALLGRAAVARISVWKRAPDRWKFLDICARAAEEPMLTNIELLSSAFMYCTLHYKNMLP